MWKQAVPKAWNGAHASNYRGCGFTANTRFSIRVSPQPRHRRVHRRESGRNCPAGLGIPAPSMSQRSFSVDSSLCTRVLWVNARIRMEWVLELSEIPDTNERSWAGAIRCGHGSMYSFGSRIFSIAATKRYSATRLSLAMCLRAPPSVGGIDESEPDDCRNRVARREEHHRDSALPGVSSTRFARGSIQVAEHGSEFVRLPRR